MNAPQTFRVMAMHALAYCERLFYLEEVEEIRVADAAVWAGRRLHEELDEPAEVVNLVLESEALGLRGKVDAVRSRDGAFYPVEHKRGRARRDEHGNPRPWDADEIQIACYAVLLDEHRGTPVAEGRIRYHADNTTVRVPISPELRSRVRNVVARARELAGSTERPPVTENERKCVRCSLAPVCLPEETRLAQSSGEASVPTPVRLFPPDFESRSLHIVTQGAVVGRSGEGFSVRERGGQPFTIGARAVSDLVIHGHAQVTTQALRACANEGIPVHFVTLSGAHLGVFSGSSGGVQRRIRQFQALSVPARTLHLARTLLTAKVLHQLHHVLRSSRRDIEIRRGVEDAVQQMRVSVRGVAHSESSDAMIGHEGNAARAYFGALPSLVSPVAGAAMRPDGRSRRPPRDRFNALLSFGYALLYRDIQSAIVRVGLEPAFGFLHQPHSAAFPLVLDLTELFRVPVVDMAVLGAVNRRTFDDDADFVVTGPQVWLSDGGRKKMIEVYERRAHEETRHPVIGYTLSFKRMMELECRLLEKEWATGDDEGGLFARYRIR